MIDKLSSRIIFCDSRLSHDSLCDKKLSFEENSTSNIPSLDSVLDNWIPCGQRDITNILEELEYMLETSRLLDLTNRPMLEYLNSVLIYTYRFTQSNIGYEECLERLVREAYLECIKLPRKEGLESKIITDLSQFVISKPNIKGMPLCDTEETITLANNYFKLRGITKPDIAAKIEQIEMLENKILISDLQALDRIPLLCDKYIDNPTTDTSYMDALKNNTSILWHERNDFISYIKSTNADIIKIIRCSISQTPLHCVWLFTTGQLDFGAIKTSKGAFQPILDMVPLGKNREPFNWSQFSAMKDKIHLLYPLNRLPEYTRNNYIDSYFKVLPQIESIDHTNYSPLKIKIAGQEGFKYTSDELKISKNVDKEMINYQSLEDKKYELSKLCGVVTLKLDNDQIIIDRNLYPSITPRFTITLHKIAETNVLLEKCSEYGIKNLTFIVENNDLAITIAKSLFIDLEKKSQTSIAPWYNKYFGIHIHIVEMNTDLNPTILDGFIEFLDQRSLIY